MKFLALLLGVGALAAFEHEQGWPQYVAGGVDFSSPLLADADGDDTLDVLVAAQGHYVYLWNHRGELFPGWPRPVVSAPFDETSSPALGDINQDGLQEVVYASAGGRLYAWHVDSSLVPGFPVDLGDNVIRLAVTLEDIDQDDSLEILVGTGNAQFRFFVFRHDGTLVWSCTTAARIHSTPATGDIDLDGDIEIFVGDDGVSGQYCIYAWHHDGTPVAGWPRVCGHHVDPGPALADIDHDGRYEVFVGSLDNMLYGLDASGQDLPGWPNPCGSGSIYEGLVSSPAVGDLDQDSMLEVVTGRGLLTGNLGAVFAFRASGETLPGFPVEMPAGAVVSSPALTDVDDDGDLEIVVGCADGRVYGLHHDGSTVAGFPIDVGSDVSSSPAVGDIDRDGNVELAVGARYDSLYVWDLGSRFVADLTPWPMFHHDARHTGRLPLGTVALQDETPGATVAATQAGPTILAGSTLFLQCEQEAGLLDVTGRRVVDLQPGDNDLGQVGAGIYFVTPSTQSSPASGKEVAVRKVVVQR